MATERDTFNEINITPLTDIFLVLLIIMMVIAPLLDQQGLNLVVPDNVETTKVTEDNNFLNITVTKDNHYLFGNEEISLDNLSKLIKKNADKSKNGLVIQTDGEATHGAVVALMDIARNIGLKNITVVEF